jgi:hypothetical protein
MKKFIKSSKKQIDEILDIVSSVFDLEESFEWNTQNSDPVNRMIVDYTDVPLVSVKWINGGEYDPPLEIYLKDSKGDLQLFEFTVGDWIQIPAHYFKMNSEDIKKELEKCISISSFIRTKV